MVLVPVKIRITKIEQGTGIAANLSPVRILRTTFLVDDDGPFSVESELAGFSSGAHELKMRALAAEVATLRQQTSG